MSIRDVLQRDHSEIDRLYSEVLPLLAPSTVSEAFSQLDLFWARLAMHIRAEHLHLFPAVQKLAQTDSADNLANVGDLLVRLRHDHDLFMRELAQVVRELRLACSADADRPSVVERVRLRVEQVGSLLAEHNRVEEEKIYPLQDLLAREPEAAAILRSIKSELANLPPRFRADTGTSP